MPQKDMPKEVSIMGGCPVPNLCSPLLYLAELEAQGKAKKARLRAQQRGRVAKGKKGRLRAALRHLWDMGVTLEVCRPPLRPHSSREADSATLARAGKREGQPCGTLPQLPPQEEKG